MRRLLTAAALLLTVPLAMGQAYKWTDAKGTVHYSDNPPPAGTKFSRMNTATGAANADTATPAAEPAKPASKATADAKAVTDTPENRSKLCATLRENLAMLRSKEPLVTQENGEQKPVDDAQRISQLATAEAQEKQYCSGK